MRPLLAKSQWISSYLKPDPPGDLTFRWHEEAVTVTCSELPHKSLLYEIQYKSTFDPEWQAEEGRSCNVSIPGLDPDKCYFFRARARTMEAAYGPDTYPSDWSEVAHQQRGRRRDSCQEQRLFPRFVLISGAVAFLTVVLLLVSLWKLRRSRFKNLILSNSVCEPFLLQFHPGRSHLDFNLPAPGPLGASQEAPDAQRPRPQVHLPRAVRVPPRQLPGVDQGHAERGLAEQDGRRGAGVLPGGGPGGAASQGGGRDAHGDADGGGRGGC
nr:PREDICTED: cytokine receptor-like factor 2 isoform X1 [Equus przewalskii]